MRTFDTINFSPNQKVWRYMRLNRFIEFIENKKLHFACANQFEDRFEGAVAVQPPDSNINHKHSEINQIEQAFIQLKRLTKISCWHMENHESDAMWKLYSGMGKGIAITSTPQKIEESLQPFRLEPTYGVEDLWGANVSYVDFSQEHLKTSMLERFFYKHNAFSWEKEFRLAISLRLAEEFGVNVPKNGIYVDANINTLISEIYIGPYISSLERDKIIEICESHSLTKQVKISSLSGHPRFV